MRLDSAASYFASLWDRVSRIALFLYAGVPTNPDQIGPIRTSPTGMTLIHSAETTAEAGMIRDLLAQAGFHVEYVPPITTGIFGTSGSIDVYVKASQAEEAHAFIKELSTAPLEGAEPTPES